MAMERISGLIINTSSVAGSTSQSYRCARQPYLLIVDDDCGVRETLRLVLRTAGYHLKTAKNGMQALQEIKKRRPALLLCDLDIPKMCGCEFLSIVRRRFPDIGVIAMSGAYSEEDVPDGVIADAFYAKGQHTPAVLLEIVADVFSKAPAYTVAHSRRFTPVWGRTISREGSGKWYVLVTCEDCLRSFPVLLGAGKGRGIHTAHCDFCQSEVDYIADPCGVNDDDFRTAVMIGDPAVRNTADYVLSPSKQL